MHAAEWIATRGSKTRRISVTRLRHELVRQARSCTWCGRDTGEAKRLWCSDYCRNEFAARTISRAGVWCKCDGKCSECKTELDSTTWEVHHVLAVSDGGGMCDASNLTALCTRCHQRSTAALAHTRSLASAVRAAKVG